MEVTTDRRSVQQCLEQRYALPTYQREYKWEVKHLRELLQDIQETFFSSFKATDSRTAVSGYEKYFLGTIITIPAPDGRRAIVDGQQRITTLALVVAYFHKLAVINPRLDISDLSSLLRKRLYGQYQFNINFEKPRALLFNLLLDPALQGTALEDAVEAIPDLDEGSRRLFRSYSQIHEYITDELEDATIPYFVDYLTQCVQLFEIGVPTEQDGHKVFVTMNDRGLKLGPIDLLKGYLLSNITHDEHNAQAHETWQRFLKKLQEVGQDEESSFFRNWLRSQHAVSIRGKQKDAAPGDFELASDSYHRWVETNSSALGLRTSDDYVELVQRRLPFFVDKYVQVLEAERTKQPQFPHVFFNGSRELTLQSMLILAALDPADSPKVAETKAALISYYLDCYATSRILNGQDNTYNNLRDPLFELVKIVRRKDIAALTAALESSFDSAIKSPISLRSIRYDKTESAVTLHILARLADYLEGSLELTNRVGFAVYVQRKKSNSTFDIEHLLPTAIDVTKLDLGDEFDFVDEADYRETRNSLGGLILLSRGRNRSLKAKPFSEKIEAYATEGVLAQTFTESFYQNNPQVTSKLREMNIEFQATRRVTKAVIESRANVYDRIAEQIWNKGRLSEIAASAAA